MHGESYVRWGGRPEGSRNPSVPVRADNTARYLSLIHIFNVTFGNCRCVVNDHLSVLFCFVKVTKLVVSCESNRGVHYVLREQYCKVRYGSLGVQ